MPPNPPSTPPPPGHEARATFADLVRSGDMITLSSACRLKTPQGRMDADVVVLVRSSQSLKESAVLIVLAADEKHPSRIAHVLPVTPSLSVALEQAPPSPSTSFFAQSSKPRIEVSLTGTPISSTGPPVANKIELQFPPGDTLRVYSLVKEIRKAISASYYSSSSYGWLAYYPIMTLPGLSPTESVASTPISEKSGSATPANGKLEVATEKADKSGETEQYPNPYVEEFSRNGFLRKRLFSQQEKWSSRTPVSVRIVTYNVNDRIPPAGTKELAPILGYGAEDILVVGLQEADLRSQSLLVSQGDDRAAAWEDAIFAGLREKEDAYEKVAMLQYVGVILFVFAKSEIRPHVRKVQGASRGIGIWGIGGNKAGVALRMKVHDTTICFVNSHLAAFASQLSRRRLDYQALRTTLTFDMMNGLHPPTEAYYPESGQLTLDDSDVLFWFGDLNYRIELEDKEILALLETNQYDTLIAADQLTTDIADSQSFVGFTEPRINFKPSYKYVHGSVTLDPKRAPAYCDRVLYIARNNEVTCNKYACHDILWSDHLPVTATFSVAARVVDDSKRSEVLLGCQGELDRLDEIYRPSLAVNVDDVDFGTVLYRRPVERELILKNTGRVPAAFSFRAPSPGKPICLGWYWPFPSAGVVPAGEVVVLRLTVCVDETLSESLTCGDGEMNDVLVLQVQGGQDTFITVHGTFTPTIVGLPLEVVPDLPDVIRKLSPAVRKTLRGLEEEAEEEEGPGGDSLEVVEMMSPLEKEPPTPLSAVAGNDRAEGSGGPSAEVKKIESGEGAAEETDNTREGKAFEDKATQGGMPSGKVREDTPVEETADKDKVGDKAAADKPPPKAVHEHDVLAKLALDDLPAADLPAATPTKTPPKSKPTPPTITTTPVSGTGSSVARTPSRPRAKRGPSSGITKPPREVWRLLERLMESGSGVQNLWTSTPDYAAALAVIDALDTGADLPDDMHAVANALLHILYALPSPLVPTDQRWRCRLVMTRDDAYTVVEKMPGVHANVLIGLVSVARLCGGEEVDKDSVLALATAIFGGPIQYREGLVLGLLQG